MDANLVKRGLTAVILIPAVVFTVLRGSTLTIGLAFGAFVLAAAWEWARLAGFPRLARSGYVALMMMLMAVSYAFRGDGIIVDLVLAAGLGWWMLATVGVIRFQHGLNFALWGGPAGAALAGCLVLVPAWLGLLCVHARGANGPVDVVVLLCVIWGADTGAYFIGRRFGSRALASKVSPGKTWEGVVGALAAVLVIAVLAAWKLGLSRGDLVRFVILCLATVPVSIVGDLAESLVKRRAGVKDSGTWLSGHGGVLDRIDSLTAAAPFFALGWTRFGAPT